MRPLQFHPGDSPETLGLDGIEVFDITGIAAGLRPGQALMVRALRGDGTAREFHVIARLDIPIDVEYYRHGGILPVRKLVGTAQPL